MTGGTQCKWLLKNGKHDAMTLGVQEILESKKELQSSNFFKLFRKQFEFQEILETLVENYEWNASKVDHNLQVQVDVVVYGLGQISWNAKSQCQLALVLLLKEYYDCIGKIYIYDPKLSTLEYDVMTNLGCTRIEWNEECRRRVHKPTIFFMPHCYPWLMNNVVEQNINPWSLGWIAILGNSFQSWNNLFTITIRCKLFGHLEAMQKHCIEYVLPQTSLSQQNFGETSWHLFPKRRPNDLLTMDPFTNFKIEGHKANEFPSSHWRKALVPWTWIWILVDEGFFKSYITMWIDP